jgi:hypothetical protein
MAKPKPWVVIAPSTNALYLETRIMGLLDMILKKRSCAKEGAGILKNPHS